MDIIFGVDASGSIGSDSWQIQKAFLRSLVEQGIAKNARVGITVFNTFINISAPIQYWSSGADLGRHVDGLWWTRGWTNTEGLLNSTLQQFASTRDVTRQQVLLMITDGNPCFPPACPIDICNASVSSLPAQVSAAGIRTVIIGIGAELQTQYVSCLVSSLEEFIPISTYAVDALNSAKDPISNILCPLPPTKAPTADPTSSPTAEPTLDPTKGPTASPTDEPTKDPTRTRAPSTDPTTEPTKEPTRTRAPSKEPTQTTSEPTDMPTNEPTILPTAEPSDNPTSAPFVPPNTSSFNRCKASVSLVTMLFILSLIV